MAALSVHKIGAGNKTSIPLFEAALVSVSLNVELEATPPAIAIVFTFFFLHVNKTLSFNTSGWRYTVHQKWYRHAADPASAPGRSRPPPSAAARGQTARRRCRRSTCRQTGCRNPAG